MDKLNEALRNLKKESCYPFHMPGHKRNVIDNQVCQPYEKDITEIDGFDNLFHAEGIIKEEQEFAAELFGAEETFFLINGSSCGILTAITATADFGKKFLLGRNSHKSAYNGLYIADAAADYLYPEKIQGLSFAGAISPEEVALAIEKENAKGNSYSAVFLTSPTYEGVVSKVEEICRIAHGNNIPVIVDEAHGAHLGIWGGNGYFPRGAVSQGADIVIQSLHKTLPSMTQTAVLHVQGNLIDRKKLKLYLSMFQSSSPSYVLMSSMSACLHFCKENRELLAEAYKKKLEDFYEKTKNLARLKIITDKVIKEGINDCSGGKAGIETDPGKIIIGTGESGLSGRELYDLLREKYCLQMEMAAGDYVIAMTSIMDTREGFERLADALREIDSSVQRRRSGFLDYTELSERPEAVYSIREALRKSRISVDFDKCADLISGEFLYLYPPGIPVIVPGERISRGMLGYLKEAAQKGLSLQGPADFTLKKIQCIQII